MSNMRPRKEVKQTRFLKARINMKKKLVIGIIPDGNRKWAKKEGFEVSSGYRRGAEVALGIIKTALELGTLKRLVFYTLSHENVEKRPMGQVDAIINALEYVLLMLRTFPDLSVQFIGEPAIPKLERLKNELPVFGGRLQIDFLAVYSATWDLQSRPIKSATIPPLDIIIRTSGETRLSGFLPWQSAYSQFFFTKTLWPDFTATEFRKILRQYNKIRKQGVSGA